MSKSLLHKTTSIARWLAWLALAGLVAAGNSLAPPNSLSSHHSAKWEQDIAVFEARDKTNPPPRGCIVFMGSSSIRLWTNLTSDFAGLPVVNRGFGGSELADAVNFADRIIIPYRPREVVIYAGSNDLNGGKEPELVYGDFVALASKLRAALPEARLAYIAIAPNPKRWAQVEKMKRLNGLIQAYCRGHDLAFIDVFPLMLGSDGLPKPGIYAEDRLHMNERGYGIWREAIAPHLR